jgi:two-component system response regulator NreC
VAIRVLIADDHAVVRAGLRALIHADPDLVMVGEAVGGTEALELVRGQKPDVLLLDMSMADLDGISVTRQVKESQPGLHVLILTVHEDDALLRAALKAGASGYILKHAAEAELISAIHIVMRGDMYVDPAMLRGLLGDERQASAQEKETRENLTPREREILGMIVQGYTNRQMGEELKISVRTVEGHRANISEKLGLHSRVELVRYAREKGLIEK